MMKPREGLSDGGAPITPRWRWVCEHLDARRHRKKFTRINMIF